MNDIIKFTEQTNASGMVTAYEIELSHKKPNGKTSFANSINIVVTRELAACIADHERFDPSRFLHNVYVTYVPDNAKYIDDISREYRHCEITITMAPFRDIEAYYILINEISNNDNEKFMDIFTIECTHNSKNKELIDTFKLFTHESRLFKEMILQKYNLSSKE